MHPVTFLTHFRIPALPLFFLLLPCWPRGSQCSGAIREHSVDHCRRCTRSLAQRGTLRKPIPSHLRLPLHVLPPGHMSSRAPVGNFCPKSRLFAPTTPTPPPSGQSPRPEGMGTLTRVCKPALLPRQGSEARGWRGPCPSSSPGGTRRWGAPAARPQPDCTGNLGFLWARGGDAAESGSGRKGEGR